MAQVMFGADAAAWRAWLRRQGIEPETVAMRPLQIVRRPETCRIEYAGWADPVNQASIDALDAPPTWQVKQLANVPLPFPEPYGPWTPA